MARVPLLGQSDLPDDYQYLLDEDAMGEINLLCAMANNPEVLQSYMRYGTTLWKESGLDGADVERCILSAARALEAAYEWDQHVSIARDLGVPEAEIEAIAAEKFDQFDDRTAALLRYVRAVATGTVNDEVHDAVAEHVEAATIVGVTQLATHYLATARFVEALEIQPDGDFAGWTAD